MWAQDVLGRLKTHVTGMREIDGASSLDAAMRGPGKTGPMFFTPAEVGRVHVERMQNRSKVA